MSADPQVPLRADARRNRDQIIAAARTIFAEYGPEVPMEEIARAAGVGVGTLYRRFPDREALIRAVAVDNFSRVLDDARQAAAEEPTAWQALVRLIYQSVELHLSVQLAMVSKKALEILKEDPAIAALRESLLSELEVLVRGAQREGTLRPDVAEGDVAMLFALLLRQLESSSPEIAQMSTARSITIMIDGLRARPGTPLPGRPLSRHDIH
ncbi:TetR/AcrR family transcriptional regulator [Amycolatopsis sp. FDAARGOS 1241]|uniref:TetR/AcrR family transcriptional regulator n=1 Tax=Amycolatopsis sp. FDAARGOS 1241 TaxID=2778070 RepID=UPI00195008EA|nr:TetR/AcrR family transcriptional regulator [Amycolatopsis sp. FDAARGOS 1241]QRP45233.1 TetR/AcrR family transcriptional regulator [Amycolatopsis sp. FDAARGOS 1241]